MLFVTHVLELLLAEDVDLRDVREGPRGAMPRCAPSTRPACRAPLSADARGPLSPDAIAATRMNGRRATMSMSCI